MSRNRNDEYVGYLNPREPVGAGIAARISMNVTVDPARDQDARLVLADRALKQAQPREWLRDMLDCLGLL